VFKQREKADGIYHAVRLFDSRPSLLERIDSMRSLPGLALLSVLAFVGCGDDGGVAVQPPPPPDAKALLLSIAESGQPIGSGGEELRVELEKVKATDAAKGDQLLKELGELSSMNNPAQIKAKAKAMADQL